MLQTVANGLIFGLVVGVAAFGLNLLCKISSAFDLSFAGTVLFGSFLFAFASPKLGSVGAGILALTSAVALGVAVFFFIIAPLQRKSASGSMIMMATLGVFTIEQNACSIAFGVDRLLVRTLPESTVSFGAVVLAQQQVIDLTVCGIFSVLAGVLVHFTQIGRLVRALCDDSRLLTAFGVNIRVREV